jgi:hypothetical protein
MGAGLRVQGSGRVRPFFDFGFALGRDSYEYACDCAGGTTRNAHNTPGMVLGGGVTVPAGKHFYVRPRFRLYVMQGYHAVAGGEVGFGWRF